MSDMVLNILIKANGSAASSGIRGVATEMLGMGGAGGIVAAILVKAGEAAVELGIKSTEMAGDFQTAALSLVAHAGLAKNQMDSVSASVEQMAIQVGRSPVQLEEALYPILSAFSGIQDQAQKSSLSLATLKMAFQAVAGTTVNGTAVAKAAVQTFNSLGYGAANVTDKAGKMKNIFDVMDKTVQLGNMTWDDYKSAVSKVALAIQGTNVTFNESQAALAEMTNHGFPSAQKASTYFANAMGTLEIKTNVLAAHAKKLGISFDLAKYGPMTLGQKLEYLNTITDGNKQKLLALMGNNRTALATYNALTSGIGDYNSNLNTLNHSQGALQASFDTAAQGMQFAWSRVKAGLDAVLIALGSKLLPVVTGFINNAIVPAVTWLSNLVSGAGSLSDMFGKLGINTRALQQIWNLLGLGFADVKRIFLEVANAIEGPVSGAMKGMNSGIGSLINGGLAWFRDTLGQVDYALGSISQTAGLATKELMQDLQPAFKQISDIAGGVFAGHMKMLSGIVKDLSQWFQSKMLPAIKQAMPGFISLGNTIMTTLVPGLLKLWAIGQSVVDKVMPVLVKMFEAAAPVIVRLAGIIAGGLSMAIKFLMPYILQAAQALANFAGDIATRVLPIVTKFWNNISAGLDWLQANWQYIWPSLSLILKGVWDSIVGVVKIAWALLSGFIKIGLDILSGNWSQAWNDLKNMLAGVWDGMKTVVQGYVEQIQGVIGGLITGILAKFGLLSGGVDQHTDDMKKKAQLHALQMKEKVVSHVIDMKKEAIRHTDEMIKHVLDALKKVKTPAEKHALEMKLKVLAHTKHMQTESLFHAEAMKKGLDDKMKSLKDTVSKAWGGLSSNIQSIVGNVKKWLADTWDKIKTGAVTAWNNTINGIKTVVSNVAKWLSDTWHKVVSTVIGWFNWLYNHNYYWKDMVDAITNAVKACVAWLQSAWANTVKWISDRWNDLAGFAKSAWQAVSSVFAGIWTNYIATPLSNLWNSLVAWWNNTSAQTAKAAQSMWQKITGVFASAWGMISGPLGSLWNSISGWFSNIASQAVSWGQNLIQGFINGINNMLGAVGTTAKNVASKIANVLGFHSPSKEGPGMTADEWSPNLMRMFVQGLDQSIPMLQSAMARVMAQVGILNTTARVGVHASGSSSNGLLNSPSTSLVSLTGNASGSSGSGNTYNYVLNPTLMVPPGTAKQQAQFIFNELNKLLAQHIRQQGNSIPSSSGVAA